MMGVVRNFIDIIGITPENELPSKRNGHLIQSSINENIIMPENIKIDTIFQITVKSEIKSYRVINTPSGKICVVDGNNKLKLVYTSIDQKGKIEVADLVRTFNIAFNLPEEEICIENIKIYLADAYFDKLDNKTIYAYYLFIIDVYYNKIVDDRLLSMNDIKDLKIFNYPKVNISKGNNGMNQLSIEVAFMSDDE